MASSEKDTDCWRGESVMPFEVMLSTPPLPPPPPPTAAAADCHDSRRGRPKKYAFMREARWSARNPASRSTTPPDLGSLRTEIVSGGLVAEEEAAAGWRVRVELEVG